jgi:Ras-related protein Rab-18
LHYYHQHLTYLFFVTYTPHLVNQPLTPFQENSRQVSTNEGSTFASRQNALFVEASAKTAIGVREVFEELVARILETPELWAPVAPEAGVSFGKRGEEDGMPGTIDVGRDTASQDDGSCGC